MTHRLLTPSLVVLMLLAGNAAAQDAPPPPRQPAGGPGGPGVGAPGFPGRGGFFPGGEGALGLVDMPEVGQELKLTERQQQSLNELRDATRQELQAIMAAADPQLLQVLDPDQRELFFAEMRKKAEATNRDRSSSNSIPTATGGSTPPSGNRRASSSRKNALPQGAAASGQAAPAGSDRPVVFPLAGRASRASDREVPAGSVANRASRVPS